jgi:hypothetical protein
MTGGHFGSQRFLENEETAPDQPKDAVELFRNKTV